VNDLKGILTLPGKVIGKGFAAALTLFLAAGAVYGEPADITGSIRWDKLELSARVTLNLPSAGIRIPAGRNQGEEIIDEEYPDLIQPVVLSIPVDSSDTIRDLIDRGEFSLARADDIVRAARRVPPSLSPDLQTLSAGYTIDLRRISAGLVRHSRPTDIIRTLNPAPAADYTGIIIIASRPLPVHGRRTAAAVLPCLFPKIWDTDMNLIYERNNLDPRTDRETAMVRYASESGVFLPTPSGLSPEIEALAGARPLRILARGVFGVRPTDPVIDRDDARLIISSENNRRLLREGRVVVVLGEEALRVSFTNRVNLSAD
jgi:hypothetical protein